MANRLPTANKRRIHLRKMEVDYTSFRKARIKTFNNNDNAKSEILWEGLINNIHPNICLVGTPMAGLETLKYCD